MSNDECRIKESYLLFSWKLFKILRVTQGAKRINTKLLYDKLKRSERLLLPITDFIFT
jgi:hypothetical protein